MYMYFIVVAIIAILVGLGIFVTVNVSGDPSKLFLKGKEFLHAKRWVEAVRLFAAVLKKKPDDSAAKYYLAFSYEHLKRLDSALQLYKDIFDKTAYTDEVPKQMVYTALARIYLEKQDLDRALEFEIMVRKSGDASPMVNARIGKIYYLKGDYERAAKFLETSVAAKTANAETYALLGMCEYHSGDRDSALRHLIPAAKAAPPLAFPEAYFTAGEILATGGKDAEAVFFFNRAYEMNCDLWRQITDAPGASAANTTGFFETLVENAAGVAGNTSDVLKLRYALADTYVRLNNIAKALLQWQVIAGVDPAFQGVADKIKRFESMSTAAPEESSDPLSKLYTMPVEKFKKLCEKIIIRMRHEIRSVALTQKGTILAYTVFKNRSVKADALVEVARMASPVGELLIRELIDHLNAKKASKGFYLNPAGFTSGARKLAESRAIDLVDGDEFFRLLEKAGY